MRKFKDIKGKVHGRLTAIEHVGFSDKNYALWKCACQCGNFVIVEGRQLGGVGTKSCGCILLEKNRSRPIRNSTNLKHGHCSTKNGVSQEYIIWFSMKQRCTNKNNINYKFYGARGVSVCERWMDFENFFSDLGSRPSKKHTIDRIDPFGNYEPSNVRWATIDVQSNNKRNSKTLIFHGKQVHPSYIQKNLGVPSTTVYNWAKKSCDVTQFYATWAKRRSKAIFRSG